MLSLKKQNNKNKQTINKQKISCSCVQKYTWLYYYTMNNKFIKKSPSIIIIIINLIFLISDKA